MPCPSSTLDALISSAHVAIAARIGRPAPARANRPPAKATYAWGSSLHFAITGNARPFLGEGWCEPEPTHCWTRGPFAELNLPVLPMEGTDLILTAHLHPLVSPHTTAQVVRVSMNGAPTGQWLVRAQGPQHVIVFERHFAGAKQLTVRFDLPRAFSPQSHYLSQDQRVLGVAFETFSLSAVHPA